MGIYEYVNVLFMRVCVVCLQSVPDMEGVVSDELRQRVERVLCFPVGGAGEGGESSPPGSHQPRCLTLSASLFVCLKGFKYVYM